MTPRERWLQRILNAKGVRPVGHADPRHEDGDTVPVAPVIPVQPMPPAPGWPPAGVRRISSTAPGRLPGLGRTVALDPDTDEDDEPGPEVPVDDEDQDHSDEATAPPPAQPVPQMPPVPAGPVTKASPGTKHTRRNPRWVGGATTGTSAKGAKGLKDEPSLRIAAFNLSAAAVGYMLSLAGIVNTYLAGAEQAARGVFELVLAAGAFVGAWWVTGRNGVREILPYPFIARPLACFGAAEIARRQAPRPIAWLNANGTEWGLGPDAVSLLITSGGICFALWWFIDRKMRRFHWTVRWVVRIPLATAAVATLRYGNPIH